LRIHSEGSTGPVAESPGCCVFLFTPDGVSNFHSLKGFILDSKRGQGRQRTHKPAPCSPPDIRRFLGQRDLFTQRLLLLLEGRKTRALRLRQFDIIPFPKGSQLIQFSLRSLSFNLPLLCLPGDGFGLSQYALLLS
jgi:hypothetical protein